MTDHSLRCYVVCNSMIQYDDFCVGVGLNPLHSNLERLTQPQFLRYTGGFPQSYTSWFVFLPDWNRGWSSHEIHTLLRYTNKFTNKRDKHPYVRMFNGSRVIIAPAAMLERIDD